MGFFARVLRASLLWRARAAPARAAGPRATRDTRLHRFLCIYISNPRFHTSHRIEALVLTAASLWALDASAPLRSTCFLYLAPCGDVRAMPCERQSWCCALRLSRFTNRPLEAPPPFRPARRLPAAASLSRRCRRKRTRTPSTRRSTRTWQARPRLAAPCRQPRVRGSVRRRLLHPAPSRALRPASAAPSSPRR